MFLFISQKEGFHEDEMFSYGSSNYRYDNVFQPYANKDYINLTIDNEILNNKNPIKKIIYYFFNPNKFVEKLNQIHENEKPIWKTKEEAREYLTIERNDILNFFSVYYNQSRDAHPPLFYFLVHIFSSFFIGKFSKHIIFTINLIFFICCCILIKKIIELMNKKHLAIPTLILYGLSIGGISTVIFQRMYMMLTFFVLYFTYINIYFIQQNFAMTKNIKLKLGVITILGFLTQYYFCIYALFMFIIIEIQIYIRKGKEKSLNLLKYYAKLALIGVVIFPASIYHIFFSYRGVSTISNNYGIIEFIGLICKAYNINLLFGCILLLIFFIVSIIMFKKLKDNVYGTLFFVIIGFILVTSKTSPYLDIRYIMGILPIIAILFWLTIEYLSKRYYTIIITIMTVIVLIYSINILRFQKPFYLYVGYNDNIKIANMYHTLKFIYIGDNNFNHIQSMPEFMIYDESLILNVSKGELKYIENDEKIKNEDEFIVSMKNYMNVEEIKLQILQLTHCRNYEILLNTDNETGNVIYKFVK